jgi:uncharacterized protein
MSVRHLRPNDGHWHDRRFTHLEKTLEEESVMATDEKQADEKETGGEERKPEEQGEQRPRRRGFAAMDRDRVKAIASKGGRAAHAAGTAHQFSSDEARIAGKKGGMAPHVRRGGVRRRGAESTSTTPAPASKGGESHGDGR